MMHRTESFSVFIFIFACLLSTVTARQLTNEELHSLPKLFHLDDYERCLAHKNGLYCLGTFELTASQAHPILELMKEHTNNGLNLNRTLLHRGYCVSERCPPERNATLRFERCVAKRARRNLFIAHLQKLKYCKTHQQQQAEAIRAPNEGQQMFLYAVYIILLLNVIGTSYDVFFRHHSNKNSLLMAWSLPSNWGRLTKINDSGKMSELASLHGTRIFNHSLVIYTHSGALHYMVFVHNAEGLEKLFNNLFGTLIRNGTSLVQTFSLISCFLTGYNLLLVTRKSEISAKMLCKWILKRLIRILPVYLLVIGYAITWWPEAGDGPLWSIVREESEICRRKFWAQVFFVNNLVEPSQQCFIYSWFLAIDMQLYILALFLTVLLKKLRVRAVPILGGLFVASGVLNVILAYFAGWEPMIKIINPENLRYLFRNTPIISKIHYSPWNYLPACFLGLFIAHFYFELTQKKEKVEDENWNGLASGEIKDGIEKKRVGKRNGHNRTISLAGHAKSRWRPYAQKIGHYLLQNAHFIAISSLTTWVILGSRIGEIGSRAVTALYMGMERMVFSLIFAVILIHFFKFDNFIRRFMMWRGWQAAGRLAFTLMMLHWCINVTIVAARPQVVVTSTFYISMDWLATLFYTCMLALPVCILVEMPMQKFFEVLITAW